MLIIVAIVLDMIFNKYAVPVRNISYVWQLVCFGIMLGGEAIRIMVNGSVVKDTSGRGTKELKAAQLNTDGFYSVVRHPLYLANLFMWSGASLFFQRWYLPVIIACLFFIYYGRIISYEERFLKSRFGDDYTCWARKVPSLIPSFKHYAPSKLLFNVKASLKKEHDSIFALVAICYFFTMVNDYALTGKIIFHNFWYLTFLICIVLWFIIKIMKKTSMLDVEGR